MPTGGAAAFVLPVDCGAVAFGEPKVPTPVGAARDGVVTGTNGVAVRGTGVVCRPGASSVGVPATPYCGLAKLGAAPVAPVACCAGEPCVPGTSRIGAGRKTPARAGISPGL